MRSAADWTEDVKREQARAIAELVRDTILAEREACAAVADGFTKYVKGETIAKRIRERNT
jgi:hypothetical protein